MSSWDISSIMSNPSFAKPTAPNNKPGGAGVNPYGGNMTASPSGGTMPWRPAVNPNMTNASYNAGPSLSSYNPLPGGMNISSMMGNRQATSPMAQPTGTDIESKLKKPGWVQSIQSGASSVGNFLGGLVGGGSPGPTQPTPPGHAPPPKPSAPGTSGSGGANTPLKPSPTIIYQSPPIISGGSPFEDLKPKPPYAYLGEGQSQHGYNVTPAQLAAANIPFPMPSYSSLLNEGATDWASPELAALYGMSGTTYDSTPYDNYSQYATSTEASPWLNLMNTQIKDQAGQSYDALTKSRTGGLSSAMDNLASKGGLRSGAAENLQRNSLRDLMMGRQSTGASMNQALNEAAITEQESKLTAMSRLPGMASEKAAAQSQLEKLKADALKNERDSQYQAGLEAFKTLMTGWAANQHAQALK